MDQGARRSMPSAFGLLSVIALVGVAAVGCSDIHPEPNMEESGMLESPTHEADAVREVEEHEEGGEGRR
jgi:hypothetical protein